MRSCRWIPRSDPPMQRLLTLPYKDQRRAMREIAGLSDHLPAAVREQFDLLLAGSPAPERGLQYFVRLYERHPGAFRLLTDSVEGIRHLTAVFTQSHFLSEEVLERPEWARQMLRIVVRDILGLAPLPEITAELSDLADVLVETAYDRIRESLVARYGVPRAEADGRQAHFAVIALGKLGGQ